MKQGTDDRIQRLSTEALPESMASAVRELCDLAYHSPTAPYFAAIGPGEHLLGWEEGVLVSHLMWVTRWLQMGDDAPLRTAYVEMVATAAVFQGQGRATALLQYFPSQVEHFDLAALCPATVRLYSRLGWQLWRGPLGVRTETGLLPTPEERVMVLPLPRSPPLDLTLPLSVEWRPGEVW
jgi:aminoglycoside 2'-N-acetyltransferase I